MIVLAVYSREAVDRFSKGRFGLPTGLRLLKRSFRQVQVRGFQAVDRLRVTGQRLSTGLGSVFPGCRQVPKIIVQC